MAMFESPRAIERDNQNSLRKFPFSDAASCTNGACVIVPGAIVDAQLYVPGREPGRVWLSSVGTDGKLYFSDADGVFAETSAPAQPDSAVPVTFTGDGGPCPGGVVVFGREADVSSLRSCGGRTFTADQAELAPAAVAWPGLPGVAGFRLDDGHVVYGAVKMKGKNGLVVATYVDADGRSRLRLSAVGRTVESTQATGFITKIVAKSGNRHFVVSSRDGFGHIIDLTASGAELTQDDGLVADREDLCAKTRKTLGTKPSERAASSGECSVCPPATATPRYITLMNGSTAVGSPMPVLEGGELGNLLNTQIPTATNKHFIGYFDINAPVGGRRYYRPDGKGIGRFTATSDITLYARFVTNASRAEVRFTGYGTLHLSAPDVGDYANPVRISGNPSPVPAVKTVQPGTLEQGGADALADIVLHPDVPAGEIHIGLRGLGKASML